MIESECERIFVYEMKLLSYFGFPISVQLLYFISIFALNHLSIVTSHFRQDIKQQWYGTMPDALLGMALVISACFVSVCLYDLYSNIVQYDSLAQNSVLAGLTLHNNGND